MAIFLKTFCLDQFTGISFVDSTPLKVCHIRREHSNKVFKGLATKGQCSIGWFFGFKLHLIINDKGEILDFIITQENINDTGNHLNRSPSINEFLVNSLVIKNTSTKHYSNSFFIDGIHLITKLRKNMKNCLMHIHDKILLKKIALIETVNDELKNIYQIEHSRHRSFENFLTNLLSGLIANSFFPKKPSLNIDVIDRYALEPKN